MQDLLTIKIENNSELGPVVSSRVLAEQLNKQHKHIKATLKEMLEIRQNLGASIIENNYKDNMNRTQVEYLLTKKGFNMYMFNIQGYYDYKEAYIDKFEKMEEQLKQPIASYMIEDPVKRAEQWIAEQKEKQQLELENSMNKQKIAEYEPKASYLDTILQNKSLVTVGQIAKDYGMSAQSLNKLLHDLKVQYKQSGQWLLYSKHHNKGYTHSSTTEIEHKDGSTSVRMNTKWTQKGRLFIYELLKENDVLPIIEK
ncbi:Rha family transcriptional regulator [Staphylococcus nepalensis]|uniref:phage regulatory protein/antirepressor Ant n=1 Tax=Staphylococcus nepalensis TaxID=214473 RepID=UPI000D58A859|nr:phage regulatory protein/antirepressor Ant [Staphylococcus nepalensis]AWI45129.1 Rha family transcriptional regulator [Staphylococcus nepalensis]